VLAKLALALARVVTRDLVVSQNKNFGRNPSWSYVKPVVTRGSTVLKNRRFCGLISSSSVTSKTVEFVSFQCDLSIHLSKTQISLNHKTGYSGNGVRTGLNWLRTGTDGGHL
jgi:hypothetical protein